MIEKIIEYSARNPFIVIVLALVLAGLGIHSVINTPVDAIPDLSENQVIVFADWMGRSPREVEDQVTYPLSVNLQGLAGVKAIRATSEFGFSMINIIFEDNIPFYFARQRVLERLSIASTFLPPGVSPYLAPDATALGQIFWYTVEGEGYDLGRLRAIQDWFVRYQLYSVPGVAEVASVGGFPIEYQIDVDPNKLRAYGVTLGELYSAVARSNSAVGGRVIQKARAEYLIRSVGWIQSLGDVERIVIKSVNGTPVYVSNVASVQFGSAYRRASLEKNGNEAAGGVVLMRFGENPLEVTKRIKQKIEQLQPGLPEGVRIVPFYERTRLIEDAIHTVTGTLKEEILVASVAILLILWHFRSALIICLSLPMSVLISFILMRLMHIPSNIMSLSGIAISIGVLVDASIVMVENATHHLYAHFGSRKVTGNTRELVLPALRTVGRPIFFSVMIMLISFVPVFSLGGMEGRMFHPLAFTKTFAMVGVALLAITVVPALIPLLVKGRLRHEQESWIIRSVIEIYRPVLAFLLEHPWPIFWFTGMIFVFGVAPIGLHWVFLAVLFGVVVASAWAAHRDEAGFGRHWWLVAALWVAAVLALAVVGLRAQPGMPRWLVLVLAALPLTVVLVRWLAAVRVLGAVTAAASLLLVGFVADRGMRRLGREFMPPLSEGTVLDMPITIPRASITQATDDLKARDAFLRMFPEVERVVGKAGRAETPTDPAPPDMIETIVNLRPREHWPKRKLDFADAFQESDRVLAAMERRGWITRPLTPDERGALLNDATMHALTGFDEMLRGSALRRFMEFEYEQAPGLTEFAVAETVRMLDRSDGLLRPVSDAETRTIAERLAGKFGRQLVASADLVTVTQLAQATADRLAEFGAVEKSPELLMLEVGPVRRVLRNVGEVIGVEPATFFSTLRDTVLEHRENEWRTRVKSLNWELFDLGAANYTNGAVTEVRKNAQELGVWKDGVNEDELDALQSGRQAAFVRSVLLWQKTRDELLKELDTVVRMPGWGNIWTQPIINRVDMLATGVRTPIGVKVYGDDLYKIQQVSEHVAEVIKQVPGSYSVVPDQIVGEGYLEINIDREKAARYGVGVGDIQDVVETALGGKIITMTVEGRQRFPVRIRYARDFREDEESVKNLLVSSSSAMPTSMPMSSGSASMSGMSGASVSPSPAVPSAAAPLQVPLSQVADIRIVEGPSMIKSENGLLRSYVSVTLTDRDIVGFVEEAQRAVAEKVKLPPGMYLEWSGQFEHQIRARKTLSVIVPIVVLCIFVILYVTYHDLVDALLMLLAVPGAVAGGILFQYLFGFNFSVAVWVGFIACFGMAAETGIIMLVYLREAVEKKGGLEKLTRSELRQAVLDGAVHRLRPKLLTEGIMIIGLAPMLWATGTGAEIMRPMAAPVLGGILVADEVIDLLLPVLFYMNRRWRWLKMNKV